jgi:DNA replication and repair protein RecF
MQVTRLDIAQLRSLRSVSLAPAAGINVLVGDNGAGKTSILEALHVMAYGRSFRGRVADGVIRAGERALEIFVEWQQEAPRHLRRAGLRHSGQAWEGRLDGEPVSQLGQLCAALAVVTFEPGSHALVNGGGEPRRRFMDWGLFHVEQTFLPHWRRYARALKQRNALLKGRSGVSQLDSWDHELAEAGEAITGWRQHYLERLQPWLSETNAALAPTLGETTLTFLPGWRRDEVSLADALLLARDRDLAVGFTSVGPHRADWRVRHAGLPEGVALSRGQAKLSALGCLLAQAERHAADRGEWPIVVLDDLASELDARHQRLVLERLLQSRAQVFLSGTDIPQTLGDVATDFATFHVEHGGVGPG